MWYFVGFLILAGIVKLIVEILLAKAFPCKFEFSHNWKEEDWLHRHCVTCGLKQKAEEYSPGLGIMAAGETVRKWESVS